jgi:hypothetical protein
MLVLQRRHERSPHTKRLAAAIPPLLPLAAARCAQKPRFKATAAFLPLKTGFYGKHRVFTVKRRILS